MYFFVFSLTSTAMSRYDNDLRDKVVNYFNQGNTITSTTQIFNIARDTVKNWVKLAKVGELYRILPRKGRSPLDNDKVIDYVNLNPDLYNREIADVFNTSPESIRRLLIRNNYTIKKNKRYTESRK